MPQIVNVYLLPKLVEPSQLTGTAVVIDILRASTTITHALAAGAQQVIPCLEVEDAKTRAGDFQGDVLLGGEREGKRIDGFDLGNSPDEYTPHVVKDKTIFFTTTNGTKAMMRCKHAQRIVIGAFVNLSAVCDDLAGDKRVELLCAGTHDEVTREDVLFAGAVVDELARHGEIEMNDQADIAVDAWRKAAESFSSGQPLAESLRRTTGGRNLIEIGLERDIEISANIDRFEIVPKLDLVEFVIR